jgi:hypothetical protein
MEQLEPRWLLSAGPVNGKPYVDLGPSDNVAWDQPRVAVQVIKGEQVNVTPASLVFTDQNWSTPQTLTVSAIDDHVLDEGAHSFTVKHTATSIDPAFNNQTLTLTVGIRDNDGGDQGSARRVCLEVRPIFKSPRLQTPRK